MIRIDKDDENSDIDEPASDLEEAEPGRGYRIKALILLLIFLIPVLLAAYELVTQLFLGKFIQTIQPYLPQLDSVITF